MLGIGLGGREDDYAVSGVSLAERGAWQDQALEQIRRIWDGAGDVEAKIGPRPQGQGPTLIVGGAVDATFERAGRWGDGWVMGGGPPDQFAGGVEKLAAAWAKHHRDGEPRKMALAYFSLGPDAEQNAERYLRDYYGWLGEDLSGMIAASAAKDPDAVNGYVSAFESAGCDELVIFPCSNDVDQVGMLAATIRALARHDAAQQVAQLALLPRRQPLQPGRRAADLLQQPVAEPRAERRQHHVLDPPVLLIGLACDQAPRLEPVDDARHVRVVARELRRQLMHRARLRRIHVHERGSLARVEVELGSSVQKPPALLRKQLAQSRPRLVGRRLSVRDGVGRLAPCGCRRLARLQMRFHVPLSSLLRFSMIDNLKYLLHCRR